MPGSGSSGPDEGSGLLHWSRAAERLTTARLTTARIQPAGRDFTGSPTRWVFED
jgi:hypothetical protein